VNGIAAASFQAGTVQGPIQIRATVDRSDNNVSNGISRSDFGDYDTWSCRMANCSA
jgi:hypothetical protein